MGLIVKFKKEISTDCDINCCSNDRDDRQLTINDMNNNLITFIHDHSILKNEIIFFGIYHGNIRDIQYRDDTVFRFHYIYSGCYLVVSKTASLIVKERIDQSKLLNNKK